MRISDLSSDVCSSDLHGIIVFPGGVGTAEEILYLLGILLREENAQLPFPLILTGPVASAPYFEQIDRFIRLTLGEAATARYQIIVGDPAKVATQMAAGIRRVREDRLDEKDSFYFNWSLQVPLALQQPFQPTHESMAALDPPPGRSEARRVGKECVSTARSRRSPDNYKKKI